MAKKKPKAGAAPVQGNLFGHGNDAYGGLGEKAPAVELKRQLLWVEGGPEDRGETVTQAYARLFGHEPDLEHPLFLEELGWGTRYHLRDDVELTAAFGGGDRIERVLPDGAAP